MKTRILASLITAGLAGVVVLFLANYSASSAPEPTSQEVDLEEDKCRMLIDRTERLKDVDDNWEAWLAENPRIASTLDACRQFLDDAEPLSLGR